jgi:HAMP domain-containing protein
LKIKTQFLLSIIFITAIAIASAAYVSVNDMRRVLRHEIDSRMNYIVNSTKDAAGEDMAKNDIPSLDSYILKESSRAGAPAYLFVADRYGNIIAGGNRKERGADIATLYPAIMKPGEAGKIRINGVARDITSYIAPVFIKENGKDFETGKVYAGYDESHYAGPMENMFIKIGSIAGGLIIISIIFTLIITGRISAPLNRILEGTQRIAAGDLKFKIKVREKNEFQALANSFNQMTGKLNDYYEGILNAFMIAVDTKNKYSPSHSMRVARTAIKIGKAMNFNERQLENLRIAAILMDIGNIGVQDNIFEKKELLTAEDFIQIQRHPEIGAKILRNIPDLNGVVPIIMEHHERYDGMGYPGGIKGTDIMTESRVLAIADAYDAMITEHGSRKVLTAQEAINELRENKGKQFDPAITEIFIKILAGEGEA